MSTVLLSLVTRHLSRERNYESSSYIETAERAWGVGDALCAIRRRRAGRRHDQPSRRLLILFHVVPLHRARIATGMVARAPSRPAAARRAQNADRLHAA